jgi:hypothetical protein
MKRVLAVKGAILVELQFARDVFLVFVGRIVFALAYAALKGHNFYRRFFTRHVKLLFFSVSGQR